MTVSNVMDLVGNALTTPTSFGFVVPQLTSLQLKSSVNLSGMKFNLMYKPEYSVKDSNLTRNITRALSTSLNVPVSRFSNVVVTADTDGNTLVGVMAVLCCVSSLAILNDSDCYWACLINTAYSRLAT